MIKESLIGKADEALGVGKTGKGIWLTEGETLHIT